MDLQSTITYIESLPLSDATRKTMIDQLREADAKPRRKSELETIIAGAEYDPPPSGWPKPSADQSKPADGDTSRAWNATGSKGQGYYVDTRSAPAPGPAPSQSITPWPYTGIGLLIVIGDLGGISQALRTAAQGEAMRLAGGQAAFDRYYQANYLADPDWNGAVSHVVVDGMTPDQAIANLQAQGVRFAFNAGQLAVAKATADGLA